MAAVERFKQESMYKLSAKKVAVVKSPEREVAVRGGSTALQLSTTYFLQHAMDSKSHNDS